MVTETVVMCTGSVVDGHKDVMVGLSRKPASFEELLNFRGIGELAARSKVESKEHDAPAPAPPLPPSIRIICGPFIEK